MKITLTIIGTLFISNILFSQLKVLPNGKVGVGTFNPQEQFQIGDLWTFTNYSTSKGINYNSYWNNGVKRLVTGFSSTIRLNSDGAIQFDAAPSGSAGTPANLLPTLRMSNAGNLTIGNTSANSIYRLDVLGVTRSYQYLINSDKRFKTNIEPINRGLETILKLQGVTYNLKLDSNKFHTSNMFSGFIAQDVQNVLPHIVNTDSEGYLSVDYIAIIPYLIQAIQEQDMTIKSLQSKIENSQVPDQTIIEKTNLLYQNNPNPYKNQTQFKMNILENVKQASLIIYDLTGAQKERIEINEKGEVIIDYSKGNLNPGQYYYSLICDGQEIDTKKMIIY